MRVVLIDSRVNALKPRTKRYFVLDGLCPGLLVQVMPSGVKSWMLRGLWPNGRNRVRRLLAPVGTVSADQVREQARQWIALLAANRDPQLELAEQRRQTGQRQALTFEHVADLYIADRLRGRRQGARGAKEIRAELVACWGERPLSAINRGDVIRLVEAVRARGQRTAGARASGSHARTVLSHCHSLFNWAALRYDLPSSPCDRLKPRDLGLVFKPRQRVLSDREIVALWGATAQMGFPFGPFIQTLLLTGARRSEISNAHWSEVDLAAKVWIVPRERAKADAAHVIPLTPDLLALLASLPRYHSGDFIFTTTYGRRPISGFSKATARLHRLMRAELGEMLNFSLHDLRRTMRTRLSELRVPEHVAELCIDHSKHGIKRVYDLHHHSDEIRSAFEAWHARLRGILEPAPLDNVVAIRR
jgi:integrase